MNESSLIFTYVILGLAAYVIIARFVFSIGKITSKLDAIADFLYILAKEKDSKTADEIAKREGMKLND